MKEFTDNETVSDLNPGLDQDLNIRIGRLHFLFNRLTNRGVMEVVEALTGTPVRRLSIRRQQVGRLRFSKPVYRGTDEEHRRVLEAFKSGKWVGNVCMPFKSRDLSDEILRISFIRQPGETNDVDPGVADLTYNGNDVLCLYKDGKRFSTKLSKSSIRNKQRLTRVFANLFEV